MLVVAARAEADGVGDLRELDRAAVAALEPALDVHAALLSPSTGIVDSHALMLALLGDAERDGAMFAFGSPVLSGHSDSRGMVLQGGGEREIDLRARWVINASGLDAVALGPSVARPPMTCHARGLRAACISPSAARRRFRG